MNKEERKKDRKEKGEKIDVLIEQLQAQQQQIQDQQKKIDELIQLNTHILIHTEKMGKHIDFINNAYEKVTKSYLFKNILG
jgi:hypothetical protein